MTSPTPKSPWDSINFADEQDALDSLTHMMVGSKMLQSEPGVLYSLREAGARSQDAQAVDQFLQSLDAEKQVRVARAAGTQINLTTQQQLTLQANGVAYHDVLYRPQTAAQEVTQQVSQATDGQKTAKTNPDGSLALGPNKQISTTMPQSFEGAGGVSNFLNRISGAVTSAGSAVLSGMNRAYNFVSTPIARGVPLGIKDITYDVRHATLSGDPQATQDFAQTYIQDMVDQGYDPSSVWSGLAFLSSGKAHTDLTGLNNQYGYDKVDDALKFQSDPVGYRKQIESNPANFVKLPDGSTVLTPETQRRLDYLKSPEFETLVRKIGAQDATVGNDLMNSVGVDPIKHPTYYKWGTAATNIAASFLIDPTMLALKAVKVAKLSQVGIDTLGDSQKAASILTRTSKLPWVNNVQRGWQRGIDLADEFRAARAAGDTTKMAAVTAQFRAELPALEPIWENFTGGDRVFLGFDRTSTVSNEFGNKVPAALMGPSEGFHSLQDAADFIGSKGGLLRLANGRAATQTSLMPGALSAFGYRKMKGITAAAMTSRSANRASAAYEAVLSRAEADPALAQKLIDEKQLVRMMPQADDAVLQDGTSLASRETDPTLLPSQQRSLALTAAGKGEVQNNLRSFGDPFGENSVLRRFGLTATAARGRLAAQRLSTLLPRTSAIDINDARSGDTIYKFALTYLHRGDANTLRALWNIGDAGQRKAIISGLIDQVGHAAGFSRTASGQKMLDLLKSEQSYSAAGSEILMDGTDPLALVEGQTRETWKLPSFYDMQKNAAKLGLWEATGGRVLTSNQMDTLMGQWKMGALFKPSTFTRNQLEGWLRTILEGRAGDAIKARVLLTARNKELWDRGYGLADRETFIAARGRVDTLRSELKASGLSEQLRTEKQAQLAEAEAQMGHVKLTPAVQHLLATESGDVEMARKIENSSMLSGQHLGRGRVGTALADFAPLAIAGRAYRVMVGKTMDEATVEAFLTLGRQELHEALAGYREQTLGFDLGLKGAANKATQIAKDGFGPATIRGAIHRGLDKAGREIKGGEHTVWSNQALDGTKGVDNYSSALHRIVDKNPMTARAVLDYIDNPSVGLDPIVNALEKEKRLTAFGTVFFPDPIGNPNVARRAASAEEQAAGKLDWARKLVDEYAYMLTGRNGEYQTSLANFIREHGVAPEGDWIADNLVADARPRTAIALEPMSMPNGGVKSIPTVLQDLEGSAYEWLVERPLQRTTTSPVFWANYAIARKGLNAEVERMVAAGFDRPAAENLAKELSIRNGWVKSEQMIDDPGQKTQFDVIARNMFLFARATQAMIRRWGTGLWQNPAAARKMMLAYEGAVHSGLVYQNAYGEPTFTYPGSGALGQGMQELSKVPGFSNFAYFPISSDMTGQVLMSVPGADNPLRMSMGPMLAVPLREVYLHLFPTAWRGDARAVDSFINGPIGAGQTGWQETFLPPIIRKAMQGWSQDQRNSTMASAMMGGAAYLMAAGLAPGPNASPAERQLFMSRLQTQTHNQMVLRFIFGLFAPAAPSSPTEVGPGGGPDFAWSIDGASNLKDEYKQILNETGGDLGRANAIFTALHPDEIVVKDGAPKAYLPSSAFETATSQSTTSGTYLPSTEGALKWLDTHGGFVNKYKSVAAYFLPEQATGQPFSDAAYQMQLQMGLRVKKTPHDFMQDVYIKHAEALFFPAQQEWQNRIAQAKAMGDDQTAAALSQQKSAWEAQFLALNPLLEAKFKGTLAEDVPSSDAIGQLADLRQMVAKGDAPDGQGPLLGKLLTAYDRYEAFIHNPVNTGGTEDAVAARSGALAMFNRWAQQYLAGTPVAAVFNGVFRQLNTNFSAITTPGGG